MVAAAVAIGASVAGSAVAASVTAALGTAAFAGVAGSLAGGATSFAINSLFAPDTNTQGIQTALASELAQNQQRGVQVNTSSTVEPIPVIYGHRRVGGIRVFGPEITAPDSRLLHMVVVWGEGPISAVDTFYIDGVESTHSRFAGLIDVHHHLGDDDQAANSFLVKRIARWTENHRLRGLAYTYFMARYDADVFVSGLPVLTADIDGRTVYDPRDTLTKFSDNPALVLRDYLTNARYGRGLSTSLIDDTAFIAAANHCDELVAVPGGTQTRYTCDGVLSTGKTHRANVAELGSSCRGVVHFSGGLWKLAIDKTESSTFTFDESNIVGQWNIALPEQRGLLNRVRAQFFDEARSWQPHIAAADSETLRTDEDDSLMLDSLVVLPFTSDFYRAKQLAGIELKQSRQGITVQFTATIEAHRVEIMDVVSITHSTPGWTAKKFRVIELAMLANDEVRVTAIEYDDSVYTLDTLDVREDIPNTNLPDPFNVGAPTELTLRSGTDQLVRSNAGTILATLGVSWTLAQDVFVDRYEGEYRLSGSADWLPAFSVSRTHTSAVIATVDEGSSYDVRVRGVSRLGRPGDWVQEDNHTVLGKQEPPAAPAWADIEAGAIRFGTVDDIDLAGYVVRYHTGVNDDWGTATAIHEGTISASPHVLPWMPNGIVTFLVGTQDTSGNYSTDAAAVTVNLGDALSGNVVLTQDEHAGGFTGTITGGTVDGGTGDLVANEITDVMWPNSRANELMWPSDRDSEVMWPDGTYAELVYQFTVNTPTNAPSGTTLRLSRTVDAAQFRIEYRHGDLSIMWPDARDNEVMWPDSRDNEVMWGLSDWKTWPAQIEVYPGVPYEFRITANPHESHRARIEALQAIVDVPDRTVSYIHEDISGAGERLTLPAPAWTAVTAVRLTHEDDGGDSVTASVLDYNAASGPLIGCYDADGNLAAGRVTADVEGY